MKLLSLYVDNYKNLQKFNVDFSKSKGKTLIIGNNGVGKSNIIEALSIIFNYFYDIEKKQEIDFRFNLKYEIGFGVSYPKTYPFSYSPKIVEITNINKNMAFIVNNKEVKSGDIFNYLPKRVIAVYSGEEKRLWNNCYFKQYDNFNKQYIKLDKAIEYQHMLYINKYYWDLLIAILAISDIEEHKVFLVRYLHINQINCIHCEFDLDKIAKNKNLVAKQILDYINPDNKQEVDISLEYFSNLKLNIGYEEEVFFNLAVLVLYKEFKIITKFKIIFNENLNTELLSEGEKKILLVYSALNLFTGENLYLLDEPDAHLHEFWKHELYNIICAKDDSQVVVTSHSPKLISLFPLDNQIILTKHEDKIEAIISKEFEAFKEILDTDITFDDEIAIRESKKPLLLVEGKTDKNILNSAWNKLYGNEKMPFNIIAMNSAEKVRSFITSVPDSIAKTRIIGLVDNDSAGQKAVKNFLNIKDNVYMAKSDSEQKREAYIITLPYVTENMKKFKYCPIEYYFNYDILHENNMIIKKGYKEIVPVWVSDNSDNITKEEYNNSCDLSLYKVNDEGKNKFSIKVNDYDKSCFSNFDNLFSLVKDSLK